jgi:hypothetical protein
MRRAVAASIALSAVFAVAGCAGLPAGTDGNLTNGWPAMPQATATVPKTGACYPGRFVDPGRLVRVWADDLSPVDCATTHYSEVALVGTFSGADAQRATVPDTDGPAMPAVYGQCVKAASDYLGGDLHTALVRLEVELPTNAAWRGGARWFRCDLVHLTDPFATAWVDHGSLKGDLTGARIAAYGCVDTTEGANRVILTSRPADCGSPHAAEFVGTFTAPNVPLPADRAGRDKMLDDGCGPLVAAFLGYSSVSQWRNQAVGWWTLGWSQDLWNLGDRTTQCFAYAYTKSGKFVGSVKGIKDQAPKG